MKRHLYMIKDLIIDLDEVIAVNKDMHEIMHIYFKNGIEIKSIDCKYEDLILVISNYNTRRCDKKC